MNYRGAVVELAQANSDIAIPLLLSTNGYRPVVEHGIEIFFDHRFSRELKLSGEATDSVDYFYGPEMDTIFHLYRDLTGHAPLFGQSPYS